MKGKNQIELRTAKLAILGAGPKAAAIAAKASVINALSARLGARFRFEVHIFDPKKPGANWRGRVGYTDGEQRLCTLIERDLGFPYASGMFARLTAFSALTQENAESIQLQDTGFDDRLGEALLETGSSPVDVELHRRYSWGVFLTSKGKHSEWVDQGRKPPTHVEFADYIAWAIERSDARHIPRRIERLTPVGGKWKVIAKSGNGRVREFEHYDGVIITGPGPARELAPGKTFGGRLLNSVNFWTQRGKVRALLRNDAATIAVLGGGGTGAAILSWLARNGFEDRDITLVGNQATVYTRSENWFENRLFSNEDLWSYLSDKNKRLFFQRINRGVVWSNVMADIEKLSTMRIIDGKASTITQTSSNRLEVAITGSPQFPSIDADLVIDATGFNAWHFFSLLPSSAKGPTTVEASERWKKRLREDLAWRRSKAWAFPRLHVPGLADQHGPGLGSLMSLGAMSERILASHLPTLT